MGREGGWLGQGGSGRKGGTGEKGGGWEEEKRGESEEGPEGGREEGGLRGLGREAQGPEPGRGRRAGGLAPEDGVSARRCGKLEGSSCLNETLARVGQTTPSSRVGWRRRRRGAASTAPPFAGFASGEVSGGPR